jgi:hypothetical protein
VRLEGLRQLKKSTSSGPRTGDLPACSIVPQPTTLPRAPGFIIYLPSIENHQKYERCHNQCSKSLHKRLQIIFGYNTVHKKPGYSAQPWSINADGFFVFTGTPPILRNVKTVQRRSSVTSHTCGSFVFIIKGNECFYMNTSI